MKRNRSVIFFIMLFVFSMNTAISQVPISNCNFNSNCPSVYLDTTIPSNIWRIGQTVKTEFLPSTNAIVTDLTNPYPVNNNSYFDVSVSGIKNNYINPEIRFDHKYISDTLHDGGYIEVSYDKGSSWKNVIYDSSGIISGPTFTAFYKNTDTIKGNIPSFNGTSNGWVTSKIEWVWWIQTKSVGDFPPAGDTLILRFHFKSDAIQTNKPGWIIDNINISNVLVGDVNEISMNKNSIRIFPNPATDEIKLTAHNIQDVNRISIFDALGHCVYSNNKVTEVISISSFHKGVYTVLVENRDQSFSHVVFVKE